MTNPADTNIAPPAGKKQSISSVTDAANLGGIDASVMNKPGAPGLAPPADAAAPPAAAEGAKNGAGVSPADALKKK